MGRVRLRPGRPQTVDDLKQQRRRRSPPDKSWICASIEISDPNAENIMIEDRDRPGIVKTVRRSRFPVNRRAVISIGTVHFRPRDAAEHFQSKKRSLRGKDSAAFPNWIACPVSKRSQLAVVRERGIKLHQILHRHFRAAQWKRESVK